MGNITLRAARVNAGLTQKEVANKLEISNKTLSNWESGKAMPKVDKIDALCKLYGRTYDEIIFLPVNPL